MKSNNKSSGNIILLGIIVLAVLFFFQGNVKSLFESQQLKDNIAYVKSKVNEMFQSFKTPGSFSTVNGNQTLTLPTINAQSIIKMLQVPTYNPETSAQNSPIQTPTQGLIVPRDGARVQGN